MRIDGAALVATPIATRLPAFSWEEKVFITSRSCSGPAALIPAFSRGEKVFITSRSCSGSAALIPAFSRGEKEWSAFDEANASSNGSRE